MAAFFPFLLFLHVAGMVLAFGPTYAFGIYADLAEQDRAHIGFNNQARAMVSRRFVVPGTIAMGITGVLLIVAVGLPVFDPAFRWLQLGIALYLGAIAWNLLVTRRHQTRIAELAGGLAAARARGETVAPPPEMAARIKAVRRDGKVMGWIVLLIAFLMVVKPALTG